jgi:hypothetical protein
VIVIGAALFGVTSILLVGILQASAGNTQAVARQQIMLRLSHAWRGDVHATRNITVERATDGDRRGPLARIGNVTYLALPGEMVRTEEVDEKAVAQERFRLREDESATFHVDEEAGTATLRVQRNGDGAAADRNGHGWEVLAATGLDLRYREGEP